MIVGQTVFEIFEELILCRPNERTNERTLAQAYPNRIVQIKNTHRYPNSAKRKWKLLTQLVNRWAFSFCKCLTFFSNNIQSFKNSPLQINKRMRNRDSQTTTSTTQQISSSWSRTGSGSIRARKWRHKLPTRDDVILPVLISKSEDIDKTHYEFTVKLVKYAPTCIGRFDFHSDIYIGDVWLRIIH